MTNKPFAGKWNKLKGEIKMKWGDLTNDEIDKLEGEHDVLIGKIQERYNLSEEEAEAQFNTWYNGLDPLIIERINMN
ncbi:CsbD family protein [Clostridium algidicarnis]|uniref:CsbD family protein n=1 Tax=Clostridium algidicarnis TaxID=37659 RepID=UPI001628C57A|nr:CsbD family protein [Clostridium algidicarnis]MBB6630387.1 CsbD family protein [Clostridium algidicarnis]